MTTDTNWHILQAFPRKYCSQPVVLNENEFIVAVDVTYGELCVSGDGIYVFYIKRNEWKLLIEYPTNYSVTCPSICYDFSSDLLYVYGGNRSLLIANINTKQCIVHNNLLKVGWYPKSIMIDNEYNLICGEGNKYHLLWNNKLYSFEKVYEFKDLLHGNANPGVLHLQSKNMIILFGGTDASEWQNYRINVNTIWKYTLDNRKWIKMGLQLPEASDIFGYASSTDDKYIFIIGGRTYPNYFETVENDFIYVIDTQQWKIMKSTIDCPQKGQYHSCIVPMTATNSYLACGYIRRFKELHKLIIPLEIIAIISSMYYEDYLHLLKLNGHWEININHIIENMVEC